MRRDAYRGEEQDGREVSCRPSDRSALGRREWNATRFDDEIKVLHGPDVVQSRLTRGRDGAPARGFGSGVRLSTATLQLRLSTRRGTAKLSKDDPGPVAPRGALPAEVMETSVISYDRSVHDLAPAVARLLQRAGPAVGSWPDPDRCGDLEDFVVPAQSLRDSKAGSCDEARAHLADVVAADESRGGLLQSFDAFVCERVLPELKRRLAACGALPNEHEPVRFWYQRPPTLRLQPGPSTRFVRARRRRCGHQHGELNLMPLTCQSRTKTTIWLESEAGRGITRRWTSPVGQCAMFHGTRGGITSRRIRRARRGRPSTSGSAWRGTSNRDGP